MKEPAVLAIVFVFFQTHSIFAIFLHHSGLVTKIVETGVASTQSPHYYTQLCFRRGKVGFRSNQDLVHHSIRS